MSAGRNVWILGGTGFIGRALVKKLSANKENHLHLLVHKNVPYRLLEPFNTLTGSLGDFDLEWMEKYTPDVIFHLARLGGSNVLTRFAAARRGDKANHRLIHFLSRLKSPPVVVYVSGSLMYGHQTIGTWADEDTPLSPISYARYYIEGEKPWIEAQQKQLLDIRFARPGWIVGSDSWFRVFYWNHYLQTGKIPLFGEGQQLMSLIHVDDCAGQIMNLAENGVRNQNFTVFSGEPVTGKVFSETLANLLNAEVEQIPFRKLTQKYGKTAAEAFTSSIPLKTKFPEMANRYTLMYPDLETILFKAISGLKHQESILAKSP